MNTLLIVLFAVLGVSVIGFIITKIAEKKKKDKGTNKDDKKKSLSFAEIYNEMFLGYSSLTLLKVILLKLVVFAVVLSYLYGVGYTNIKLGETKAFEADTIRGDMMYISSKVPDDPALVKSQEIAGLQYFLSNFSRSDFFALPTEVAMSMVTDYLDSTGIKYGEKKESIANKAYHRAYIYLEPRSYDHFRYLVIALLATFITEVLLLLQVSTNRSEDGANIEFLKKLFVLTGPYTNQPSDSVAILIEKARPKVEVELKRISEALNSNERAIPRALAIVAKDQKTQQMRLFFEKLMEAYTGDFNNAVNSMRKELKYDRNEVARKYKKHTTLINSMGQTLFIIIIAVLLMYFILPMQNIINSINIGF